MIPPCDDDYSDSKDDDCGMITMTSILIAMTSILITMTSLLIAMTAIAIVVRLQ